MYDKPQGYKKQANALNICRNQGLSNLYQTDKEEPRLIPMWNKRGECIGFKNSLTGSFINPNDLPVDEITGYRILPSMADVPFLFAEYGQTSLYPVGMASVSTYARYVQANAHALSIVLLTWALVSLWTSKTATLVPS